MCTGGTIKKSIVEGWIYKGRNLLILLEQFEVSFSRAPLKSLFVEHPFVYGDRTQSWWSLSPGCQSWLPIAKYM